MQYLGGDHWVAHRYVTFRLKIQASSYLMNFLRWLTYCLLSAIKSAYLDKCISSAQKALCK